MHFHNVCINHMIGISARNILSDRMTHSHIASLISTIGIRIGIRTGGGIRAAQCWRGTCLGIWKAPSLARLPSGQRRGAGRARSPAGAGPAIDIVALICLRRKARWLVTRLGVVRAGSPESLSCSLAKTTMAFLQVASRLPVRCLAAWSSRRSFRRSVAGTISSRWCGWTGTSGLESWLRMWRLRRKKQRLRSGVGRVLRRVGQHFWKVSWRISSVVKSKIPEQCKRLLSSCSSSG